VKKVFLSYKHDDRKYLNDIKAIRLNPNSRVEFIDWSLSEPVLNSYGHINRRPPFDPYSNSVNNKIFSLISEADKMLVLIGNNTHSSEWVQWEIKTFRKIKSDSDILLMRTKGDFYSGCPPIAQDLAVLDWSIDRLMNFIEG